MKVLGLCSYPLEAACTRYRLMQFVAPLAERGIDLTVLPFLDKDEFAALYKSGQTARKAIRLLNSSRKRLAGAFKAREFDALFVQREMMLFGPPVFEWLYQTIGKCPLILDLDDATYLSYISPAYGRLGSALKFFGKTDTLIGWSETVICGNKHIAEYVEGRGKRAVVIPTVVDTNKFHPVEKDARRTLVIGWIGTHSTFPLLVEIFPVLQDLARKYNFILKIVGAGQNKIELEGVRVENLEWTLEREIVDFQSLDIGLYPLTVSTPALDKWLLGKSGFKAIQYMAVGIPFVMTPTGICAEIGEPNETHFNAATAEDWYNALDKLLSNDNLRKKMGESGKNYSLENFTLKAQAEKLARTIRKVVNNYKK